MRTVLILTVALVLLVPTRVFAQGDPDLQAFHHSIEAAMEAAERNDVTAVQHASVELHDAWAAVEDGVRVSNADAYHTIEAALEALDVAVRATPANVHAATAALKTLDHEVEELSGSATPAQAVTVGGPAQEALRQLNIVIEDALTAARAGDVATARAKYDAFRDGWFAAETGVRAMSRDAYRAIEGAMGEVQATLASQPVDTAHVVDALRALEAANEGFILGTTAAPATPDSAGLTLVALLPKLSEAQAALEQGDVARAAYELDEFRAGWPDVEGVVAAKDAGVYRSSEDLMARAAAALATAPANVADARTTIGQLRDGLEPFATSTLKYGVFDAASILLREGLEALLIMAALLAFLQKSGEADKRRWIWAGGLLGVAVSVLSGVVIQRFFSTIITGTNRELIEGLTGLVAAMMLFYVSFWLHRTTQLQDWQRYIRDQTNAALATGSLFSLALLAFLAVVREGAETTLFYIGIAPSIAQRDLVLGLAIGTVLLTIIGIAIIGLGRRIPLKAFFTLTSLLIFYLGFKFIGTGIHALQVARVLPARTSDYLPSIDAIGLYPTWESTILQLVTLALALVVVVWLNRRTKTMHGAAAA